MDVLEICNSDIVSRSCKTVIRHVCEVFFFSFLQDKNCKKKKKKQKFVTATGSSDPVDKGDDAAERSILVGL